MASKALASPAIDADAVTLVDWLEFEAFFSKHNEALLDEVYGSLKTQEEGSNDNIADADAEKERFYEDLENEISHRQKHLGDAYPYALSNDGERLTLKKGQGSSPSFYILCLVLSHITRSPILATPPADATVRDVRKRHFQILSTLAVAGEVSGPAISLGWPRASGGTILQVVARGCAQSQTGAAKQAPGRTANPTAKDGGIDVLAWPDHNGRPPPASFWFGQAASGHGWPGKSSKDYVPDFMDDYYLEQPRCNHNYVTICPFIVADEDRERSSLKHGLLLDRLRAPAKALAGMQLSKNGIQVDEASNAYKLAFWLGRYRKTVRAA